MRSKVYGWRDRANNKEKVNYKYARNFEIDLYYIFLKGPRH